MPGGAEKPPPCAAQDTSGTAGEGADAGPNRPETPGLAAAAGLAAVAGFAPTGEFDGAELSDPGGDVADSGEVPRGRDSAAGGAVATAAGSPSLPRAAGDTDPTGADGGHWDAGPGRSRSAPAARVPSSLPKVRSYAALLAGSVKQRFASAMRSSSPAQARACWPGRALRTRVAARSAAAAIFWRSSSSGSRVNNR